MAQRPGPPVKIFPLNGKGPQAKAIPPLEPKTAETPEAEISLCCCLDIEMVDFVIREPEFTGDEVNGLRAWLQRLRFASL